MFQKVFVSFLFLFPFLALGETTFYLGENQVKSVDGLWSRDFPMLLKRTVDKAQGEIREEVVYDGGGGKGFVEMKFSLKIEGSKYTLDSEEFSGGGKLYGAPWKWRAWTAEFDHGEGQVIKTVDHLTEDGLISTSEFYFDGKINAVTYARLKKVSGLTHRVAREKLLGK